MFCRQYCPVPSGSLASSTVPTHLQIDAHYGSKGKEQRGTALHQKGPHDTPASARVDLVIITDLRSCRVDGQTEGGKYSRKTFEI